MTGPASPSTRLRASLRPVMLAGAAAGMLFVGGFSTWSALAPLASAAIAPGVVSPESSRKTIQHLEGGIVEEIMVRDGDSVSAGDLLLRLSSTQAWASFDARQRQWYRLEAERLRLEGLERGEQRLEFPGHLGEVSSPDYQAFLANQKAQFDAQREGLAARQSILERRMRQLEQEVAAIERENHGLNEQLDLVAEEISDKEKLISSGLIRKPDLLALQRLSAEIRSTIAANEASIARASQRAEEIELSKLSLISDFNDEVSKEISRVNSELAQYEQAMVATRDVVTRTDIRAPVDGTVFNLRVKTVGGVVAAGDPILEIVPHEDTLIVEARLSPSDIDMVASGQPARVHLTPFAARHMAPLEGHLLHISSDVLIDTATHASYYELRIAVDADHMASRPDSVALTPGMPAEVYIMTGEQSLFSYLAAPLTRSFRRALREE